MKTSISTIFKILIHAPLSMIVFMSLCMSGCKSTNSVELFHVNPNGELVNIGRNADTKHSIYGQFREEGHYDRAAVTITNGSTAAPICYIKVNGGKLDESQGLGIRIEPCADAEIISEGSLFNALDDFSIYYKKEKSDIIGTYTLYHYTDGDFRELLSRPIEDAVWKKIDAIRKIDSSSGDILLTYTDTAPDGTLLLVESIAAQAAILSGEVNAPAPIETPAVPDAPAAEPAAIVPDAPAAEPAAIETPAEPQ